MCVDLCVDMRIGMCIDLRVGMCIGMCTSMCVDNLFAATAAISQATAATVMRMDMPANDFLGT